MAFNPFNLFKGNPRVLELMNRNQPLDVLLMEEAFISEFKRSENEVLHNYMNYEKYEQLVDYITVIDQENVNDKNKSYRFPFVAAQILAVNNQMNFKYLLEEVVFTEEEIEEDVQVEKEVDSDRSYSSIKSNNSNRSSRESKQFQEEDKENFLLKSTQDKVLDDYLQEKQINEDDFPDAPQKKTVLVKETAKKIVKVPFEPLVFKIIRYFSTSSVVHILDGYISKVLENIILNRFQSFMTIIQKYDRFDQINSLFTHIDSNSVQQFLLNFINKMIECESVTPLSNETSLIAMIQNHCLESVSSWHLEKITLEDREYYLNLYFLFIQKLNTKIKEKVADNSSVDLQKQLTMLSKITYNSTIQTLTSILGELIEDHQRKFQNSRLILSYLKILKIILFSFLTLRSIKTSEKIPQSQRIKIQQIIEHCEDAFDCIVNLGFAFIFQDFLIMEGEGNVKFKPQNSITSKLQFLQIIGKLTEENVYFSRKTIIDNPFYDHILKIMNLYPHSSIFHNSILNIVMPFISAENDVSTINKFFQKKKFFSFIHNIVEQDYKNRYEMKKSRCCYIAQIISICMAIQKLQCGNSDEFNSFRESQEWKNIHDCLLVEEKGVRQKILGGFEKQVEKKPIIFFTKKDCLNHFRYFLTGVQYSAFEEFQNYEPGNSDSEEEVDPTLKYLIEEKDNIKEQKGEEEVEDDTKYFDDAFDL